jgi:hypothetical protein
MMQRTPKDRSMAGVAELRDRRISYVGHKPEIVVNTDGSSFIFKQGESRAVPASLAESLLNQPDKFKEE